MKSSIGVVKAGGIALILSGILFLIQYVIVLPLPAPPSADAELLDWLQKWKFNLSMADEVLIFAAISLIPAIVGLYRIITKTAPILTLLGCGLLALSVPVYIVLVIFLGRLVYPVYNLELSPDTYRLVLSLYYGGQHTVVLLLSFAAILLTFVIRKSPLGKPVAYLGLASGLLGLVGAFPWLISGVMAFVCQVFSAVWFILLGIKMTKENNYD